MSDELEKADRLVPVVYPRSLLYLVSGILEDEPDKPLVGMQRDDANQPPFHAERYPEIQAVRRYLQSQEGRTIWSLSEIGPGRLSNAARHGDFDNDQTTLASLAYIISHGF